MARITTITGAALAASLLLSAAPARPANVAHAPDRADAAGAISLPQACPFVVACHVDGRGRVVGEAMPRPTRKRRLTDRRVGDPSATAPAPKHSR